MLYARRNKQPDGEQLFRLRFHPSPQIGSRCQQVIISTRKEFAY